MHMEDSDDELTSAIPATSGANFKSMRFDDQKGRTSPYDMHRSRSQLQAYEPISVSELGSYMPLYSKGPSVPFQQTGPRFARHGS